jgi:ferritin-like metal-binding protein YciE
MKDYKGTAALDAGLIGAAQSVEHYEMSRYGTLKRWAEMLDHGDAADLLNETLEEEEQTDVDLSALADSSANPKAQMAAE